MSQLGYDFCVRISDCEEIITTTDPAKVTEELSMQKAEAVANGVSMEEYVVIGADTVVACDGKILGKPKDGDEAYSMINSLQGKAHQVYTGVSILTQGITQCFSVCTDVYVSPMTPDEIQSYVETQEPYDKAGGYGIQGVFGKYIQMIHGDFYNVVGLPIHELYERMKGLFSTQWGEL